MSTRYHSIIMGGGVLGVAAAIALQRRLRKHGKQVLLIEKRTLGAGLSSRHSGIVRSAHRSPLIASWAVQANGMWRDLRHHWGIDMPMQRTKSLWVAPRRKGEHWQAMAKNLRMVGVDFDEITAAEARRQTSGQVRFDDEETIFSEQNCLMFDPSVLREIMAEALKLNDVDCLTQTAVDGIGHSNAGFVREVQTQSSTFECEHLINALGAWSPQLFAQSTPTAGLEIPVSMERVFFANFLAEPSSAVNSLPLIADFQNNVYFRRWPGAQIHMHAPRSRDRGSIARCFESSERGETGPHAIYDASARIPSWVHAADYASKLSSRFPALGTPTQVAGEFSYFDITPDHGFILGADPMMPNLHHLLGAGEAMKFAPALGEVIADSVLNESDQAATALLRDCSIARFRNQTSQLIPQQAGGQAL